MEEQTSGPKILTVVLLFALGFLFVASLLHLTIHDPIYLHADMRSEKLLMLQQLRGTVSSAAFGSSHIHNGFDPRVFDHAMNVSPTASPTGSRVRTRTINLAISGGSQSEQRTMALEFLKDLQHPPRNTTCLVMLELNAGANLQNVHLVHPRSIDIYDWRTARFVSHLTSADMSITQRAGRIGFAVLASMLHYTNIGMLSNKIFAPPINPATMEAETGDDRRGLESESFLPSSEARLDKVVADQTGHFATAHDELFQGNYELVDELAAASPVSNVSFVYFIFPKLEDLSGAPDYPDHLVTPRGRSVPIINLARPDLYPYLYQTKLWHDEAHLDGQGAELITRLFADQLRAWYATHGTPPGCGD